MSRADKIRQVAQQAHDNGDCECVTITISREDAEELLRVAGMRENPDSWIHSGAWVYASELRLQSKLRAALEGER